MTLSAEIVLASTYITLEPLKREHAAALKLIVKDGELWKLWYAAVPAPEEMEAYVEFALSGVADGNQAFAVIDNATRKVIGTTRFYNWDHANKRAMLGYTWYAKSSQRTPVNTECKFLLLRYFFEQELGNAVEFRTHFLNRQSRQAIERLGAKQDGILRNHQIMKDGSIRDTVIYSIVASEWPSVKNQLLSKLGLLTGEKLHGLDYSIS